ncbi:MAG: N-6 DNA methylase [Candidatus Accumulibacter phosphatis]|uniref:type I restriction-modification system subunit M n=1 Tax=Candidatus Accumulibacter phosphatis TaxID=327160 RepID=UPI001A5D111F|nr:N-6 DNA methylase [Candidatus Accumulibacter phosphatis]
MAKTPARKNDSSANLGFEAKLWLAADKLRNNMDAAEYKHVVLGLIFLKYISDTFDEHHARLVAGSVAKSGDYEGAKPEDKDEYLAANVFWVPVDARWAQIQSRAKLPSIGKDVDDAMVALERDNARLKGALNKNYGRADLDKHRLGELIDLIGSIQLGDISIYGQESNPTTRRLAIMNLALRGIEADFGVENADTFRRDLHPDLRADYVLANPPFNDSDWFRKDDDVRWQFGVPPKGNANFAWVQHFIHHLAPAGFAGFVLANGSMSSSQSGEGDIRQKFIEADLVESMVALPGQLFYSTQIPVCLWFLTKSKAAEAKRHFRERRKRTLFIDARKLGTLIDRVHRELTDADLQKIVTTYHAWRGDHVSPSPLAGEGRGAGATAYEDLAGFCKSATTAEIAAHGFVLTPGRYVGAEEVEDDGEPFAEEMPRLVAELHAQFAESAKLEQAIRVNMEKLGYGL